MIVLIQFIIGIIFGIIFSLLYKRNSIRFDEKRYTTVQTSTSSVDDNDNDEYNDNEDIVDDPKIVA